MDRCYSTIAEEWTGRGMGETVDVNLDKVLREEEVEEEKTYDLMRIYFG